MNPSNSEPHNSEPRCPDCGGLEMEYRWKHRLWDEKVCAPQTCSNWRVIGMSRGGSPILRVVEG